MVRLSTTQLRKAWAPACVGPWARVTLHGGAVVTVDPLVVPPLLRLNAILVKWGYRATAPDCGGYNCRPITGGSGYSLHAFGIAVDINWLDNPYRRDGVLQTDMPAGMVAEIEALRTVDGWQVWGWGGRYKGSVDAMHFEIVCAPLNLASGIAGAQPREWDQMASKDEIKAAFREVLEERESPVVQRLDAAVLGERDYPGHGRIEIGLRHFGAALTGTFQGHKGLLRQFAAVRTKLGIDDSAVK